MTHLLQPLRERAQRWLGDLSLSRKLRALYLVCILLPVVLMDSLVIHALIAEERAEMHRRAEGVASAALYTLAHSLETADTLATGLYISDYVQDYLAARYPDPQSYVDAFHAFQRSYLQAAVGLSRDRFTLYVDNDTIINGGGILQLDEVRDRDWYRAYAEAGRDVQLQFLFDGRRRALFLRNLCRSRSDPVEKLLLIELDYANLARSLSMMHYDLPVYVCAGDNVLFTNVEANNLREPFDKLPDVTAEKRLEVNSYGAELTILVLGGENPVTAALQARLPVVLPLLLITFLLPLLVTRVIARSIVGRIRRIHRALDGASIDKLVLIPGPSGRDEIGALMRHYNRMSYLIHRLIQVNLKNRIREREMDLARKDAELRALYSQINPHFLFNALETIRMRSVLKSELETARMVQALSALERERIDWSCDMYTVSREMEVVRGYLEFQRYRLGDRLSYRLNVQEGCGDYLIPKLAITTFVENACIHGFGGLRTPGWIFVRVYQQADCLHIEVEDTGKGMDAAACAELSARMNGANLDLLRERKRVGVVNVCLRLRMVSAERASFAVESEQGVGTEISITLPLERMKRRESNAEGTAG